MKGGESMFEQSIAKLNEMRSVNDASKLVIQLREAEEKLQLAESMLKKADDRWEFESIESDIKDLKWTIHQLKIATAKPKEMSHFKRLSSKGATTFVKTFNEEAKQAEEQYKQASGEIIGQLNQLGTEISKALGKLGEIESAAIEAQQVLNYLPVEAKPKVKPFEIQRVKKSNLQVVTLTQQLKAILQQLREVK